MTASPNTSCANKEPIGNAFSHAFDCYVTPDGYAWWYIDALSDDGQHGLTLIAFVGSVFSPYYAWARRSAKNQHQDQANPLNHCAMNVALYARPGTSAPTGWAMTERGEAHVQRSPTRLTIGPSNIAWDGDVLSVTINEMTAPWGKRLKGVVRVHAPTRLRQSYALDAAGRHQWCPITPHARVDVAFEQPAMRWAGTGYLDTNRGERPLEQDFNTWTWSRAALARQRSAVLYDVTRTDGSALSLALQFDAQGQVQAFQSPPVAQLPPTAWRLSRTTRSDGPATAMQSLEDGPFYSRSVLQTQLLGESTTAVHESLSMTRWSEPLVQCMLPFRMPRRLVGQKPEGLPRNG